MQYIDLARVHAVLVSLDNIIIGTRMNFQVAQNVAVPPPRAQY